MGPLPRRSCSRAPATVARLADLAPVCPVIDLPALGISFRILPCSTRQPQPTALASHFPRPPAPDELWRRSPIFFLSLHHFSVTFGGGRGGAAAAKTVEGRGTNPLCCALSCLEPETRLGAHSWGSLGTRAELVPLFPSVESNSPTELAGLLPTLVSLLVRPRERLLLTALRSRRSHRLAMSAQSKPNPRRYPNSTESKVPCPRQPRTTSPVPSSHHPRRALPSQRAAPAHLKYSGLPLEPRTGSCTSRTPTARNAW